MNNQIKMVQEQILARGIKNPDIIEAFYNVPRDRFVLNEFMKCAFSDGPLPIEEGQTISQPYIVALMTELLKPEKTHKVLEICTGSGYQTAILAELCKEVYTIEIRENLSIKAQITLEELGYKNIYFKIGSGYEGWPEHEPYDLALITCATDEVPHNIVDQLKNKGRIVLPISSGFHFQELMLLTKFGSELKEEHHGGVRFVPMIKYLPKQNQQE